VSSVSEQELDDNALTDYDDDENDDSGDDEHSHLHVLLAQMVRSASGTGVRAPRLASPTFHHIAFLTLLAPLLKPCAETASVSVTPHDPSQAGGHLSSLLHTREGSTD